LKIKFFIFKKLFLHQSKNIFKKLILNKKIKNFKQITLPNTTLISINADFNAK
jgi:hypothetical protein